MTEKQVRIPQWLDRDPGDLAIVAATEGTKWAQSSAARRKATIEAKRNAEESAKYTPQTQPRDTDGKFKRILARLKTNLGGEATAELAKQIESAEAAQIAGNYGQMRMSSTELIGMIDNIQDGELPRGVTNNLRAGAADLGRILAYLPLPQGDANAKVRFTDLPPAAADMVRDMVTRIEAQLDPEKAEEHTKPLKDFMSGVFSMTSDQMASNLNKLLRFLV